MKRQIAISLICLTMTTISFADADDSAIKYIQTADAPKPIGPYSQGTLIDLKKSKLLFVSGQIALDPKTGTLKEDNIQEATNQTLDNIAAILKAAGSDWKHVVRMEVFLKDLNDWTGMNDEYSKRFPDGVYPARQATESNMKYRIEISAIAIAPETNP